MSAKIYAEIGSTWYDPNPDIAFENALEAINVASVYQADGVKFQLFRADSLYSKTRAPDIYEKIKKYELPIEWLEKLSKRAFALRLEFGLSVFSIDLANIAVPYVDFFKIASGDLTNSELLCHVCDLIDLEHKNIGIQISTGAANLEEINHAIDILKLYDLDIVATVYHCVSTYPAWIQEMNLAAVSSYRSRSIGSIGLSDHTKGNNSCIVAQMAIAAGYTVFEKHVNLSGTARSPDDVVASNKNEFMAYVQRIRLAEKIMGNPMKEVQESEKSERIMARRGADGLRPAG